LENAALARSGSRFTRSGNPPSVFRTNPRIASSDGSRPAAVTCSCWLSSAEIRSSVACRRSMRVGEPPDLAMASASRPASAFNWSCSARMAAQSVRLRSVARRFLKFAGAHQSHIPPQGACENRLTIRQDRLELPCYRLFAEVLQEVGSSNTSLSFSFSTFRSWIKASMEDLFLGGCAGDKIAYTRIPSAKDFLGIGWMRRT
jgi:hypothetical protein